MTRGSVFDLLAACRDEPGIDADEVVLPLVRIGFDVSVNDVCIAGRLRIATA